jgi:hypothetical protein
MLTTLVCSVLALTAIAEEPEGQCLMSLRSERSKKHPGEKSNDSANLQVDTSIAAWLRGSKQLGLILVSAASHESVSSDTTELLRSFRPCATCNKHKRYGESHDGGYVMCDDDMELGQLKAAYSYGVNGFDGWGNAISEKYQIPVFEYDCTNSKHPEKCPTCDLRFNSECIIGNSSPSKAKYGTLSQHFQRNGHGGVGQSSMLLKIDVEGAEWPVFSEEPAENLRKFREIVVEFHNLDQVSQHPAFLHAVKNILGAGFVVEHIHGNNNGGKALIGGQMVPKVLEVTYLQRPADTASTCLDHSVLLPEDAQNNVNMPDLPPATLPKL